MSFWEKVLHVVNGSMPIGKTRGLVTKSVEADMEDPRPRYKKRHCDDEFLGKGAACGECVEADMEDPRPRYN